MHLDYLDKLIPKRWQLLLRYWLPFFKTPSNFYFECRFFINKLKRLGYKSFPWDKLPNLVFIFEKYAYTESEIDVSQKILDTIFIEKTQPMTQKLIEQFFDRFNPDNTRTPILNGILQRLPPKLYSEYFSQLNAANCSSKNLKWCARLKDKFRLEDKLSFILSLPDDKLMDNESTLFNSTIQECEELIINPKLEFNKKSRSYIIVGQLLEFILTHNRTLIFSNLRTLISELLKNKDQILKSHIQKLDAHAIYNFFENFLADSQNVQGNIQFFFHLCSEKQWSNLIDQLIISVFNATESEMTIDNPDLLFLTQLQEPHVTYPLNLFQFLAIKNLTKKPLDLEALKKVFKVSKENPISLEHRKNFSIECQSAIAENSISAIKVFIKDRYVTRVPKESSRHDIHRAFYQFFNNEFIGKPLNVAELLLKKLPMDLQSTCEKDLNFLQQLLTQLYLVVDDPAIVQYKNECLMAWNKDQRDYEEKSEARRELLQRIREGKQSSIAYQRMEELFGPEAQTMQEKWKKALGVHFFDANDKEERKIALQEAAEIIKFNRGYNDFSCLSTSPSSTGYFAL